MTGTFADPGAFARQRFEPGASLEPLAGDASTRHYYRLSCEGEPSRVLLFEPQPFEAEEDFFLLTAAFLHDTGLPVPRVLESYPADGVVVLEDLGSTSLESYLQGQSDPAAWRRSYEEAVDLLLQLQHQGSAALGPDVPAYHYCLEGVRFRREMDYFIEHYVDGLLGDPLTGNVEARQTLERSLSTLADAAGRPGDRILCHRDFHSRNLMLSDRGNSGPPMLVMIDFQDARLGPGTYDLASLLEDAYLEVPDDLVRAMKERFQDGLPRRPQPEAFEVDYARVAAQRTLKAVGTFAGQAMCYGNAGYLGSIPRALACACRALAALPEHAALLGLLEGPLAYRGEDGAVAGPWRPSCP